METLHRIHHIDCAVVSVVVTIAVGVFRQSGRIVSLKVCRTLPSILRIHHRAISCATRFVDDPIFVMRYVGEGEITRVWLRTIVRRCIIVSDSRSML